MQQDDLQDQIKIEFGSLGQLNLEAISECASICRLYSLKPQDLRFKWEAYAFNSLGEDNQPTPVHLKQLHKEIQRDFDKQIHSQRKQKTSAPIGDSMEYENESLIDIMQANGIPVESFEPSKASRIGLSQLPIYPSLKRPGSLPAVSSSQAKIEETLNLHLSLAPPRIDNNKRCEISLVTQEMEHYRYMFDKISEKAQALDDRIEYFAELLQEYYHIEDFANPSHPSQDPITAVGRVCCDAEGRLNDQSVLLETSRRFGGLYRVKLALGNVPEYTLFPGQIIGVQGPNITGHYLTVTKILPPPLPPLVLQDPADLFKYTNEMNGQPLTFIIAAGPYTLEKDLLFNPLQDLVDKIIEDQPDLVVLECHNFDVFSLLDHAPLPPSQLGPFVDIDHPLIKLGDIDCSLESLFQTQISMRLQRLDRACPGTTVILIPHVRDACHDHAAFPQPPLKIPDLHIPKGVTLVSNPCQLRVNECVVAVSSADVLLEIGSQELARPKVSVSDRMGRLSRHILQQRSFYPLFPPAPGDNLDFEHMPQIQLEATPDVLILNSRLRFVLYFCFSYFHSKKLIAPRYLLDHNIPSDCLTCSDRRQCRVHQPRLTDQPRLNDQEAVERNVCAYDVAPAATGGGRDRWERGKGVGTSEGRYSEDLGCGGVLGSDVS
ncbi:DNA polymerase alpha/epsilon subunit B-domain-containing protein, partial [Endogone sp. FLAS-F59071]